jgi:GAF domain-containing protein
VTGAERGFVLVAGEDGKLCAEVASGFALAHLVEERFAGSVGAVERALASRRPVVLSDARTDPVLGRRPSVVAMGLGTLACVPLERDGQILGLIYVDSRRSGSGFTQLDEEVLEALAYSAAVVLDTLRLDHRIRGLLRPPASGAIEEALLGELQRRLAGATRGVRGATPGIGEPEPGFPGEG